ncbi:hypothetical protein [Pseudogemmobacter humi]|nr:hypothetical protein [Pseudogemmobacter humi]
MVAPAAAGTLEGRTVTFTVMTWDDPAQPYLQARGRTVTVGDGVEFGLEPEGFLSGLDVVPVTVEIAPQRIELSYPRGGGRFYEAQFNGYVLRFETECALFRAVRIDPEFTTMQIQDEDIFTEAGALYINTSGREYGPEVRLGLDIDVGDCPIS